MTHGLGCYKSVLASGPPKAQRDWQKGRGGWCARKEGAEMVGENEKGRGQEKKCERERFKDILWLLSPVPVPAQPALGP